MLSTNIKGFASKDVDPHVQASKTGRVTCDVSIPKLFYMG